jgi:hypothetical protein
MSHQCPAVICFYFIYSFFAGTGICIQGFVLANWVLCLFNHTCSLFALVILEMGSHELFGHLPSIESVSSFANCEKVSPTSKSCYKD